MPPLLRRPPPLPLHPPPLATTFSPIHLPPFQSSHLASPLSPPPPHRNPPRSHDLTPPPLLPPCPPLPSAVYVLTFQDGNIADEPSSTRSAVVAAGNSAGWALRAAADTVDAHGPWGDGWGDPAGFVTHVVVPSAADARDGTRLVDMRDREGAYCHVTLQMLDRV